MKKSIYCEENAKGTHNFYLQVGQETYYLFSQAFRTSVSEFFGKGGVSINQALDFTHSRKDTALTHTMEKLFPYIQYIEQENRISVLDKTCFKGNMKHRVRTLREKSLLTAAE